MTLEDGPEHTAIRAVEQGLDPRDEPAGGRPRAPGLLAGCHQQSRKRDRQQRQLDRVTPIKWAVARVVRVSHEARRPPRRWVSGARSSQTGKSPAGAGVSIEVQGRSMASSPRRGRCGEGPSAVGAAGGRGLGALFFREIGPRPCAHCGGVDPVEVSPFPCAIRAGSSRRAASPPIRGGGVRALARATGEEMVSACPLRASVAARRSSPTYQPTRSLLVKLAAWCRIPRRRLRTGCRRHPGRTLDLSTSQRRAV